MFVFQSFQELFSLVGNKWKTEIFLKEWDCTELTPLSKKSTPQNAKKAY